VTTDPRPHKQTGHAGSGYSASASNARISGDEAAQCVTGAPAKAAATPIAPARSSVNTPPGGELRHPSPRLLGCPKSACARWCCGRKRTGPERAGPAPWRWDGATHPNSLTDHHLIPPPRELLEVVGQLHDPSPVARDAPPSPPTRRGVRRSPSRPQREVIIAIATMTSSGSDRRLPGSGQSTAPTPDTPECPRPPVGSGPLRLWSRGQIAASCVIILTVRAITSS
jgi:hypothetical protein